LFLQPSLVINFIIRKSITARTVLKLKTLIPLLYRAKEGDDIQKKKSRSMKFKFNREKSQLTIMKIVSRKFQGHATKMFRKRHSFHHPTVPMHTSPLSPHPSVFSAISLTFYLSFSLLTSWRPFSWHRLPSLRFPLALLELPLLSSCVLASRRST